MKKAKKLLALLISFVMVLAMSITAFADETAPAHTITINNTDSTQKHTYEAYQVFKGTLSDGKLTKLEWGSGVDGDAIIAELKTSTAFANVASAQDVADIIAEYTDNSANIDAFAAVVGKHLNAAAATSTEAASPYTLSVTGDGYYFVKDKDATVTAEGESYSKYMLKVVKDETIEAKDDHLTPTKKIVEGENKVDENSAAIGDTITYEISIPMPKMDGYETYLFQMEDTMDKGLTFEKVTSIKVGSTELVSGDALDTKDYTITTTGGNGAATNLNINYKHFITYKGQTGSVVVTYTAKLNENAEIVKSNDNKVHYIYSNDPSHSGHGENENEPNPSNPTGKTPDSTVKTWVTKLELTKTGDNGTKEALAGAQFTFAGEDLNVVLLTGTRFVEAADGTYYKLKDGSYTTTAPVVNKDEPTKDTTAHYEDITKKYKEESYTDVKTEAGDGKKITAVTGADGTIVFTGLKPGTYTLTEDVAPAGYNKIDAPISFTIEWTAADGFKVPAGDTSGVQYDSTNKMFKVTVDNKSGSTLPSTGGMGTTIFYVLGSILVLGAAVLLISKRRMVER